MNNQELCIETAQQRLPLMQTVMATSADKKVLNSL
jgi:hypothetical protein